MLTLPLFNGGLNMECFKQVCFHMEYMLSYVDKGCRIFFFLVVAASWYLKAADYAHRLRFSLNVELDRRAGAA